MPNHREIVGGLWEEIGRLQFEFLKRQGLRPEHRLLDVGCGCLRGGIHFVPYLDQGNYYGLDINAALIEAGQLELAAAGLQEKKVNLLVNNKFDFSSFGVRFDFALAHSVFTHLFLNQITRCLFEMKRVLPAHGKFYATFFQAPHSVHLNPILHSSCEYTTHYDSDPFHYSFEEIQGLAENANLVTELIGEWQHPRSQKMLCFSQPADS